VKVHVVGFDVSEDDRKQLQCIADMGKGRYFSADSTAGFADAVSLAVKVAAAPAAEPEPQAAPEPEPEPQPQPQPTTLFFDDFEGAGLAPHWEVRNADPESYLVEDGGLIAIAYGGATLEAGDAVNLFRLDRDLPRGDWVATLQYRMPYQTGREAPFFGIYEDKDNHLVATANAWSYYDNNTGARLYLSAQKLAKGEKTSFSSQIWGGPGDERFALGAAPNPFVLRITKQGRSYIPAVRYSNGGEDVWVEGERITALRQKGRLAFGIYQAEQVAGETPIHVDWVRVEALQ
jgi:Ca-activated chloride channel homolog